MSDEPLVQQLITFRGLLDEFHALLTRAPVAPVGLEDLTRAVDTEHTSMWATLAAGHGTLAHVRVERLKLRRAIEGVQGIRAGLTPEWAGALHPEHIELQSIARELANHIGTLQ